MNQHSLSVTLIAGWGSSRCAPSRLMQAPRRPAPNTTSAALSCEPPSNLPAPGRQAVGQGPAITCALAKIVSPPTAAAPTSAAPTYGNFDWWAPTSNASIWKGDTQGHESAHRESGSSPPEGRGPVPGNARRRQP